MKGLRPKDFYIWVGWLSKGGLAKGGRAHMLVLFVLQRKPVRAVFGLELVFKLRCL